MTYMCLKIKNPTKLILLWQVPNVLPKSSCPNKLKDLLMFEN